MAANDLHRQPLARVGQPGPFVRRVSGQVRFGKCLEHARHRAGRHVECLRQFAGSNRAAGGIARGDQGDGLDIILDGQTGHGAIRSLSGGARGPTTLTTVCLMAACWPSILRPTAAPWKPLQRLAHGQVKSILRQASIHQTVTTPVGIKESRLISCGVLYSRRTPGECLNVTWVAVTHGDEVCAVRRLADPRCIRNVTMLRMPIVIAPLVAFLIGLCAVPTARWVALECGFLDNPDRWRKLHEAPIALGGGIAVWLATWSGWGASLFGSYSEIGGEHDAGWFLAALGLSSLLMLGLGVIDDCVGLRARYKLAGQLVPALVLVFMGTRIDVLRCFGIELPLGICAWPATVVWILLIVNAFNLIDGMDGFCGSLGLITSMAIAFLAYRSGRVDEALLALALAGALAAFLRFNLPPAKIYLGDAGSMTIGLLISGLSIRSCGGGPETTVHLMPVIALLLLPLLDIVTALCRRWLRGRSILRLTGSTSTIA